MSEYKIELRGEIKVLVKKDMYKKDMYLYCPFRTIHAQKEFAICGEHCPHFDLKEKILSLTCGGEKRIINL